MTHLELVNLTKRYGDVVSVDGIDLTVEKGELICLLGPSGCGKTTTLRMIAGFLEPDAGEIRVGGKAISSPGAVVPPERRNMGMIFQSYAVWPHMTVRENVGYGLRMKKVAADSMRERVDAKHGGGNRVESAGRSLDVGHGDFAGPGRDMSFCVKTHDIELVPAEEARGDNVLPGVVRSQAYLGSTRDYIVDIGQEVLVTAPPAVDVPSGSKVGVRMRAERLRGLVR